MNSAKHISLADWGLMVMLSVIWAGSFLFVGIAVKELSPLVIVLARVVLAAAGLVVLLVVTGTKLPRDRASWITIGGLSVLNNILPFILIVTGQTMIASGLASVINATTPLFGVAFIAMAGLEPLVARKVGGLLIGVAGVAIIKGGTLFGAGSQSIGILCCLGAAACYGLGSLWAKAKLKGISPVSAATGQLLCSSAIMMVFAFAFDDPWTLLDASLQGWLALLGLSLLATSFAYVIFYQVVQRAGPANVLLVTMMIPASAIAMGFLVLHETLEPREIIGALIIIGALVIIDGRVVSLLRRGGKTA
ncbi:DMT family transporter [Aestuariivirga sp.]|uniref:DMT family transporter n=1 Tax=Aestuariivirga sp. TaxID=2650926 RepID=UPI00359305F2